jgi:putative sterol carrier protein
MMTPAASFAPSFASRFFEQVPTNVIDALPSGVAVVFELSGPEGGRWTVERDDEGRGRIREVAPPRPDCRLKCSTDDFRSLLQGTLDPRDGFLEGRFEVEGDVGLVLALHRCLIA